MIESILERQLGPIARRHAEERRTKIRAVAFGFGALVAIEVVRRVVLGQDVGLWGIAAPLIAAALGAVVARFLWAPARTDLRSVARELEQENPELGAMLLTAVEEEERSGGGELGYLQEQLVYRAAEKAIVERWRETVGSREYRIWHRVEMVALVTLVASFVGLGALRLFPFERPESRKDDVARAVIERIGDDWTVEVTPGDVEIEKGSRLLVTASFDGGLPSEAFIEVVTGGESRTLPMSQNLSDPVFAGTIPRVEDDGVYRIRFAGGVTRDYSITTFELPEVVGVDVSVIPPGHAGGEMEEIIDARRVSVLEGSEVRLRVRTGGAVAEGRLVPSEESGAPGESTVELVEEADDPTVFTHSLTATNSVSWRVELVDDGGRRNRRPPELRLNVKRNLPPRVDLGFPGSDVEVSPLQEIMVEASVWDDLGITAAGASMSMNGETVEVTFDVSGFEADKRASVSTMLDFESWGASPNDLMTYFFWAEDRDGSGETRRVVSDLRFAEVRHFEEIFREAPGSAGEQEGQEGSQAGEGQEGAGQSGELVEAQKEIINAIWGVRRSADEGKELPGDDIGVIAEAQNAVISNAGAAAGEVADAGVLRHLEEAIGEMRETAEALETADGNVGNAGRLDEALDHARSAYGHLLGMREREFQVARSNNSQSRSSSQSAASQRQREQLDNMELQQEERRYETQRFAEEQRQSPEPGESREDLQMMNRLKELARRQEGINERTKEIEAMLQEAETEAEREELRRELKRLEDEQREMLDDLDELNERMEEDANRSRTTEAREQLEQARNDANAAAEAMAEGRTDRAANAGTRAERQFEEMAEDFRERSSGEFAEGIREARQAARELTENQRQIAGELDRQRGMPEGDETEIEELARRLGEQEESLEELGDRLREMSEEAEDSEPLLSRKLYDELRESENEGVDDSLEAAEQLTRFGRLAEAAEFEEAARRGIDGLRDGIEAAAESVLGDEESALRMARSEIENLMRDARDAERNRQESGGEEGAGRGDPAGEGDPGESSEQGEGGQTAEGEQSGERGQGGGSPNDEASRAGSEDGEPQNSRGSGRAEGEQGNESPAAGGRPGENGQGGGFPAGGGDNGGNQGGDGFFFDGWSGDPVAPRDDAPIYGEGYREWTDRLRDVEEMLQDEGMQQDAARVRDRARQMRRDFNRDGQAPQWGLMEEEIIGPLRELKRKVDEELSKRENPDSRLPLDRDPVPPRFEEIVRDYYERLGGGE